MANSSRGRVDDGAGELEARGQIRKLRDYISIHTQEAKRANWKWDEAVNSQSLPPRPHWCKTLPPKSFHILPKRFY